MKPPLLILFIVITIYSFNTKANTLPSQKNILFINSYSSDFPTYVDVKKAIELYNDGERCQIDIEFLNAKELFDHKSKALQYEYLKYRIGFRRPYDAIVTIDNNALDFAFTYRDSLFPNVPLVFCGVEDARLIDMAYLMPGVSGITEFCAFRENIDLALKLNPKLTELVALTDMTVTGKANTAIFNETINDYDQLSFRSVNFFHHDLNGFLDTISAIKGEKAILLISAYRDSTNFYYNFEKMVKEICHAAKVPVYHLYHHGLGEGIAGGKLLNHYNMARNALKLAIENTEILWDTKTIYNHETQNYYIDYQVARSFGLDLDNAPLGSIFINHPSKTLNIRKGYFHLIILSILLLSALSTILTLNIRSKKKINLELKKAKERAEESDRFKTAFIANMSHELRTPMNSIIGFSSFFREDGIEKETRERYCDIIEQNANQLLALINDIIDIAKIESGELSFAPIKSNLYELVNALVLESEKKIERKNKNIRITLQYQLPANQEINTDVTRFKQLMNNLLYNAIKYTEEGQITVSCKTDDNRFLFSVSDTGIGISDLMKEKVFDRFTREEDAKKLYSGTGLGLAIAKSIVEKWGGEIWFESQKNKGSTFYFTHPI